MGKDSCRYKQHLPSQQVLRIEWICKNSRKFNFILLLFMKSLHSPTLNISRLQRKLIFVIFAHTSGGVNRDMFLNLRI